MRQINDYLLWIGNVGDVRDTSSLFAADIRAVIDLAANEPVATIPRELIYCRFPLVDGAGNPPWLLRAAFETVRRLLRAGVPTLVACGAGMSRSPAVAAAALASVRDCSHAEALAFVCQGGVADVSPGLWSEIESAMVEP